jgi:DNA-binding MarR family transcriptional regulator
LRLSARTAEQRVGLSGAQLFVLQCLGRENPCSVNQLAARTATDQSSVSVVVSRLVEGGLVRRAPSPGDKRSVELRLTPSGRALLKSAPDATQERLIGALQALSASELRTLARTLGKVVGNAEVAALEPTLFFEEEPRASRVPRLRKVAR